MLILDLTTECLDLRETLEKLNKKLKGFKAGTGGGTFEWVNSILVTALQKGQWLLIDNVNFCRYTYILRGRIVKSGL